VVCEARRIWSHHLCLARQEGLPSFRPPAGQEGLASPYTINAATTPWRGLAGQIARPGAVAGKMRVRTRRASRVSDAR
jgi:hypothetical protein